MAAIVALLGGVYLFLASKGRTMPLSFCLEVAGDFACFSRPEFKVERVSYDVMTPSSARAIFDAILWKPAIFWQVTQIEVLEPIRWISVRRNEVGRIFSTPTAKHLKGVGTEILGLRIEDERQQRAGLLLRDVKYRIHADLLFDSSKDQGAHYGKYAAMFERRAENGQCFNQPYLGCREFSCQFRLIRDLQQEPAPITETRPLGWMLYDMDFADREKPTPRFFPANLTKGVVRVPAWNDPGVRG